MARERQPKYLYLNPEAVKSYRPPDGEVSRWHRVTDGQHENFRTIAAQYRLPVEKIIEFNFPGSVEGGRVIPEIVNWYLHHHKEFGCPETHDRINRIFRGGEKIAIPRMAAPGPQLPTLAEAKKWFVETAIPLRTVARGYSTNRIWKGFRSENVEDANGLCGDVSIFVAEEYFRHFKDFGTSDGYIIGSVLWEGESLIQFNHIANVMLLRSRSRKESYIYDSSKRQTELLAPPAHGVIGSRAGQYDTASLFALWVFDLYYKMPPHPLGVWWMDRDSSRGGKITIGLQADFA